MASLYGIPARNVLVGRGSDEAIDLLVRAFCRAGIDGVVTCPPTFGFYKVAAKIQGAEVIEVPLETPGFSLDTRAVISAARRARIVFLCSPNNPTGNLLDEGSMLDVCSSLANQALVCVDEAYLEFSGRESLTARLSAFPNLVVLRTLSKAYALAGARCGTLIADAQVVDLLRRIIPPYALPATTVESVLELTDDVRVGEARQRIDSILREREALRAGLSRLPLIEQVLRSDANFVLVRCRDARRVLEAGINAGLLVRDFSGYAGLERCLRVSVGTPEQNRRLMAAVENA
jgi:histidinol-phosphate aminotransferase